MTTGFAGSRCLDERRRRRLVSEADEHELNSETESTYADDGGRPDVGPEAGAAATHPGDPGVSHFPLGRLISRKLWKLWAVGVLALLVGGNLLLAGTVATAESGQFGPGFSHLFDLTAGRALQPFATLLLLMATQLAWFIWWVRSQSPRDFDGRYRQWSWCAALGMFATLAVAGDLHHAWSKTAMWLWDLDFWKVEIVVWLLPICLAAAWALRTLHREMRDCRSSLAMLWMAAGCGLCIAGLQLNVVQLPLSAEESRLMSWGLELSACWLLFMSLLLHARHVVHVTPDPAQLRPAVLRLRSIVRLPRFPKRKQRAEVSVAAENVHPEQPTVPVKDDERTPRPTKRKQKPAPVQAEVVHEKEEESVAPEPTELPNADELVNERPAEPETPSVDDNVNDAPAVSVPTDAFSMKGLSKRERRKLRKQQKDAARAAQSQRRAG